LQVSFDIECASADDSFPDAERDGCEVIQIGSTVQALGAAQPALRHIITLGQCNPIPGVCVESYGTEREVIDAFARLLRRVDADIILGWNTFQFDMDYIYKRACRCKIRPLVLGRLISEASTSHEMTLQSAAHGSNNYNLVTTPGVLHLDIMEAVKREQKASGEPSRDHLCTYEHSSMIVWCVYVRKACQDESLLINCSHTRLLSFL
jgi:DNA polymerase delta subunit 1